MPRGKTGAKQLGLGQQLPHASSLPRRRLWTVHRGTGDYNALPTVTLGQLGRQCWVVARSQLQCVVIDTVWPSANCSISGPVSWLGLGIRATASQGGCGGRGCGRALWDVTQGAGRTVCPFRISLIVLSQDSWTANSSLLATTGTKPALPWSLRNYSVCFLCCSFLH